jgi:hypothetical protein
LDFASGMDLDISGVGEELGKEDVVRFVDDEIRPPRRSAPDDASAKDRLDIGSQQAGLFCERLEGEPLDDCRRIDGDAEATDLPAGRVPAQGSLNLKGLDITQSDMSKLFAVDTTMWQAECDLTEGFFDQFGSRLPKVLTQQLTALRKRLT